MSTAQTLRKYDLNHGNSFKGLKIWPQVCKVKRITAHGSLGEILSRILYPKKKPHFQISSDRVVDSIRHGSILRKPQKQKSKQLVFYLVL